MKAILVFLLTLISSAVVAQSTKPQVMTLGTFHFNFPNLDVNKVSKNDQIDVLQPSYQKEIEVIVNKIARFNPTIIVIERRPSAQHKTDSALGLYLKGNYQLKRNEEEQIGFRLARRFGLSKLYCVDEWGNFTPRLDSIVMGKDSMAYKSFAAFYENNPDRSRVVAEAPIFKTKGILAALIQANEEENITKSLGAYLVGPFKYESKENDFTGVDFETGRWFSRNLKIFRNIQRIPARPSDRILVIYGAGHLNLLNYFFDCSPEFNRLKTNDFLK